MAVTTTNSLSGLTQELPAVEVRPSFWRLAARSLWTLAAALLFSNLLASVPLVASRRQSAYPASVPAKNRTLHQIMMNSFPLDDSALASWISSQAGTRPLKIWREEQTLKVEIERDEGFLTISRQKLQSLGYRPSGNDSWYELRDKAPVGQIGVKPGTPVAATPMSGWALVWLFCATSLGFLLEALIRRSRDSQASFKLPPLTNGRPLRQIRDGVIAGVLLGAATAVYGAWLLNGPARDEMTGWFSRFQLDGTQGLALLVVMVVVAPIAEELFFRGCIYGLFERHGYVRSGIIFSSLMFGLLHLGGRSWPAVISATVLGLALGLLCRRAGSLLTPMTAHATINATICLVAPLLIH